MLVEAGDSLKHIVKFKTATVTATIVCNGLKGIGISSSSGPSLGTGGANFDTIYLGSGSGPDAQKIVPDNVRKGNIPVIVDFRPEKVSVKFGKEVLTHPGTGRDDSHQVQFGGGGEGCGFTGLIITGIPDKDWMKAFIAAP